MGTVQYGYIIIFYLMVAIQKSYSSSITAAISDIEKTHESIYDNVKYQLGLNQSIPGIPDKDYPIYNKIPNTTFSCSGKLDGYYSDVETRCQAFRVCANTATSPHGFAFLCPNGTLFSQKDLVCNWYRNVNCNDSMLYYNSNVSLGTELDIINTIKHMIEYPIKILREGYTYTSNDGRINNKENHENYDFQLKKFDNMDDKKDLLINNLGKLSADVNFYYQTKNDSAEIKKIIGNNKYEMNLALNINNLAEIDFDDKDLHHDKQTFRFLSQEFTSQKLPARINIKQQSDVFKSDPVDINPKQDIEIKNHNEINTTNAVYDVDVKTNKSSHNIYNINTSSENKNHNEINTTNEVYDVDVKTNEPPHKTYNINSSSADENNHPKFKENLENLQKYSSHLLISGIIQTYVDPKSDKNDTSMENKHFSNFYTRRLQQKYKVSSKSPIVTTTINPVSHNRQTISNRLTTSRSKIHPTKKTHTIDNLFSFKAEKKRFTSLEDDFINTQTTNYNRSAMEQQKPTWDSVRKNLMRYQIRKNNLLHQSIHNFNPNISSSRINTIGKYEPIFTLQNNTKGSIFKFLDLRNKDKLREGSIQYSSGKRHFQNNDTNRIINDNDFYINQQGSLSATSNVDEQKPPENLYQTINLKPIIAGARENPISGAHFENDYTKLNNVFPENYIDLKEFLNRKFGAKK